MFISNLVHHAYAVTLWCHWDVWTITWSLVLTLNNALLGYTLQIFINCLVLSDGVYCKGRLDS